MPAAFVKLALDIKLHPKNEIIITSHKIWYYYVEKSDLAGKMFVMICAVSKYSKDQTPFMEDFYEVLIPR